VDHAKEMLRERLRGIALEDSPVGALGFVQAALLVNALRLVE
jgi:hypothetical protein